MCVLPQAITDRCDFSNNVHFELLSKKAKVRLC